jgi:hypothetical protein
MELESVFEELGVLGYPLSNYADSRKVVIIYLEAYVPLGVLETT